MRRKLSAVVVVALVGVVGYAAQPGEQVARATPNRTVPNKAWPISGDWAPVQAVLDERAATAAEVARIAEENRAAVEAEEAARVAEAQRRAQTASRPPVAAVSAPVADGSVWDRIAQCESGGNWAIDTNNGYSGGLQISGHLAGTLSKAEQIEWATEILARQGPGAWPVCSYVAGLR